MSKVVYITKLKSNQITVRLEKSEDYFEVKDILPTLKFWNKEKSLWYLSKESIEQVVIGLTEHKYTVEFNEYVPFLTIKQDECNIQIEAEHDKDIFVRCAKIKGAKWAPSNRTWIAPLSELESLLESCRRDDIGFSLTTIDLVDLSLIDPPRLEFVLLKEGTELYMSYDQDLYRVLADAPNVIFDRKRGCYTLTDAITSSFTQYLIKNNITYSIRPIESETPQASQSTQKLDCPERPKRTATKRPSHTTENAARRLDFD